MVLKASARTLALSAMLAVPMWGYAPAAPAPVAHAAVAGWQQRCFPEAVLKGKGKAGKSVRVGVCVGLDGGFMTVSAPAVCGRGGCDVSGSWRMTREGRTVASGELGARAGYPGPGTYGLTAVVRVRPVAAGLDVRGRWTGTVSLGWPVPVPTHRVDVAPRTIRAGRTTTVTYTVTRSGADGDSNARLGMIGQEKSGVVLSSSDRQCGNPLAGASAARRTYVLDCALVDLRAGRPMKIRVRVRVGTVCSSVVSKMGYWLPKGQEIYTGHMLEGPVVRCVEG